MVGETVDFTVTLENDGNVAAVTPAVALFDADGADDAAPLATATANTIAVADETTVTISWDTDGVAAGEYSLRADAELAGDVDSTNDSGTATLTLLNSVDVAVSFTSPIAATAVRGNSVSVPFTVTNAGNHDTGAVTVSLYVTQSGAERGQPTATTTVPALAVGKSGSGTLTWDTAAVAVGDYELELVADTAGDTVATNDSVTAYVELRNWMKLKNVAPQSSVAVVGNAVTFTAQVENVGTGEVAGVTVGLYESQVTDPLGSAAIASIAAGDTADASIQWDTDGRDVGQVELFVSAVADGQAPDRDDYQSASVTINNPIALSSAAPAAADNIAGTVVSINVGVGNASVAAASGVTVALYVGDDETPKDSADVAAILARQKERGRPGVGYRRRIARTASAENCRQHDGLRQRRRRRVAAGHSPPGAGGGRGADRCDDQPQRGRHWPDTGGDGNGGQPRGGSRRGAGETVPRRQHGTEVRRPSRQCHRASSRSPARK